MNRSLALMVVGMLMLMIACKPGTPSQYIQPDEMEDLLVDYYMAKATAQKSGTNHDEQEYLTALYTEAVLKKYGVSQAELDSSLVFYYKRADRFKDVCKRVSERLDELALTQGASEGEIGKYAHYNATGDTANVWADRTTALLMPVPPYNRWEFNIAADSTYRRGDQLMMMFMCDYMYQSGNKNALVYMALEYDDTVVSRNLRFSVSGISQLHMPEDTLRQIRSIKGFFYLDAGTDFSTTTRLLFLNNVQLIRFHTKAADYDNNETILSKDSIPRDTVGERLPLDTLIRRDSVGGSDEVRPLEGRDALHRVDARPDSVAP